MAQSSNERSPRGTLEEMVRAVFDEHGPISLGNMCNEIWAMADVKEGGDPYFSRERVAKMYNKVLPAWQ